MKKAARPENRFINRDQARRIAASPNSLATKSKSYKESYEMAQYIVFNLPTRHLGFFLAYLQCISILNLLYSLIESFEANI